MNTSNRIIYALNAVEWKTFFPGAMREEAIGLSDEYLIVNPEEMSVAQWEATLASFQPNVIVAAWKCHAIPAHFDVLTGGKLKYVCYLAGSIRKLVTESILEKGLIVSNWGNVISRVVAECGLMLAIAALRKTAYWQLGMHLEGEWKTPETVSGSLFERRVGIHGFGAISQALAILLKPFDVKIEAYSPSVPDGLLEEFDVKRSYTLEALFSENDVIFELAALTPQNEGIVTEALLRSIPVGGAFINIGRGAVVDEAALARVASEGQIQVGLDVYGIEPLPKDSPFRGMKNIVLLPHLGGPTTDRRQDSGRLALSNLKRYGAGETLEATVSAQVYARST